MIHTGDCVELMRTMDAESIDAIVTDPPYGLEFMGKEWDNLTPKGRGARVREKRAAEITPAGHGHTTSKGPYLAAGVDWQGARQPEMQGWHEAWAREAFRVAKPGAHLLAFGGTRTYHRLASAIEDAGWEIRDCLVWAYASGFPKSLDVSKAIDKAASAGTANDVEKLIALAGTDDWQGWGTALKPAWEPIVMARKPLRGTVAANVLAHGTGALNIDATRIGTDTIKTMGPDGGEKYGRGLSGKGHLPTSVMGEHVGRWPANLILTVPIFDGDVPGVVGGGTAEGPLATRGASSRIYGGGNGFTEATGESVGYGDSGTYSRFFLIPKSSRSDREPVLRGQLAERQVIASVHGGMGDAKNPNHPRANSHPTVKPIDLMRHLVRLVTPPGGTVLDCFLGSGTTAIAAEMEGFAWIGIEKEPEYVAIAEARLNGTQKGLAL